MIVRAIYSFLFFISTPWIKYYLTKRSVKLPDYLDHWHERFKKTSFQKVFHPIWIHAVSVGETRAAVCLVKFLKDNWPNESFLITQMTPTGRTTALEIFGQYAEIRYLPYDYKNITENFIKTYRPKFGLLMETEIWPNLIYAAHKEKIPLFLVNARLSEKSFHIYAKISCLIRPTIKLLTAIAAQSQEDAVRFIRLGAAKVEICGNMKYDIGPSEEQRYLGSIFRKKIGKRAVIVCASTRSGEEELILKAWFDIKSECLLLIVPRHPDRFEEVEQLIIRFGFTYQRRTDNKNVNAHTQIWLGDSMGEMFAYYFCADIAFIGGSLLSFGGQNLIEAASVGIPIIIGPSVFNFKEVCQQALNYKALIQVNDAEEMVHDVFELLKDKDRCERMKKAALSFSFHHRGASKKIVELIKKNI